jgi:hypothetical protein
MAKAKFERTKPHHNIGTLGIALSVDRDKLTGRIQIAIGDGHGGYRIAGPTYCGMSETIVKHVLDKRDVAEIRYYLRKVK